MIMFWRLVGLGRPVAGWLVLAMAASLGALAANVALMATAPYLISTAARATEFAAIGVLVTAVRAFAIGRAALRYAERYLGHMSALRALTHLRVLLYRAIEPLAPGGLAGFRSGDVLARVVADVDTIDGFFVRGLVAPAAAVIVGAAACVVLALLAPALGLTLLAFMALAGVAVPLIVLGRSRRPAAGLVAARGGLHSALADHVHGRAELLAFGRDQESAGRIRECAARMEREQGRLASVRGAGAGLGALLGGTAALALLVLAIPLVRAGSMDVLFLAAVPLVGLAAFEGVQAMGDSFREIELGRAAGVRTFELLSAPSPVLEPVRPLRVPALPEIELRHVRFRYPIGRRLVLDDLSLCLPPGGRIGVAGPSGAGKTTIINLLLRFWEAGPGEILIDGRDIRRYPAQEVRTLFGVVPQRIHLFNGTLRDNLLLADGGAPDERLLEACDRAQLGDLLASLPAGLGTMVGEDGLKLSGGERQRVALARVFLRDAPILILDEATASLDPVTERRVLGAVDAFAAGRSLLVISHRPAPLCLADQVIELLPPARSGAADVTHHERDHADEIELAGQCLDHGEQPAH
jgi:thiol reductant ABC exporter CydC subunit